VRRAAHKSFYDKISDAVLELNLYFHAVGPAVFQGKRLVQNQAFRIHQQIRIVRPRVENQGIEVLQSARIQEIRAVDLERKFAIPHSQGGGDDDQWMGPGHHGMCLDATEQFFIETEFPGSHLQVGPCGNVAPRLPEALFDGVVCGLDGDKDPYAESDAHYGENIFQLICGEIAENDEP